MRIIINLLLITVLIACNTTKTPSETKNIATKPDNTDDKVFNLRKGGCFGSCPTYTLNIYNNRYVEFIGMMHTEKSGTHAKTLDKDTYKSLITAFDEANFMGFQDSYESNIPDLALIKMSYRKDGLTKTVEGKRERPESLHKLQFLLEKIAESNTGWTFVSASNGEMKKEKVNKSQIVVDIARGNQLAKWFSEMKDKFGVQILRKLSDNSDSWLIGINPNLHKPEEVLEYLQNDPVVKKAAFKVEFEEN